ncbi:MAG: 1-acyl-sn-glycerol-3-phosphate acyltransferase [Bacteroidales bacterium]|nr:1-acyl-sn-glycerol-3-phosphate acyltransferase [Bacteroidales bacterium]
MKKAGLLIYSIILWTFFLISSVLMIIIDMVIWVLTRWFDKRLVVLHLFSCFWGSLYIWFNPLWRVRIKGRRNIPWRRSCVIVSNHQSMLDILVLYHLFVPYKWVSKKENFNIPIIGWNMRLNDYLEIQRGRKSSYGKLLEKVRQCLGMGSSVLIFPEGTRYPGGHLGPFKEGAFRMALENKSDIIPIVLDGTARALPKKGAILTGFARINVNVLAPISYHTFAEMDPRELQIHVWDIMAGTYARLQSGR